MIKKSWKQRVHALLSVFVIIAMLCSSIAVSYAEEGQTGGEQSPPAEQVQNDQPATDPAAPQDPQVDPGNKDDEGQSQSGSGEGQSASEGSTAGDKDKTGDSDKDKDGKPKDDQDKKDEVPKEGEDKKEEEKKEEEDKKDEPVAQTLTANSSGYAVKVICGEDAGIPEGAELVVEQTSAQNYYAQAADLLDADRIDYSLFLDIKIMKDGKEIEPTSSVQVQVSLANVPEDDRGQTEVIHFDDGAQVVASSGSNSQLNFSANSFSVYGFMFTVEFRHGEYRYTINGEEEILLSTLLNALGVEADLTNSTCEISNRDIFELRSVFSEGEEGLTVTDWRLMSREPFTTEETLTVALENGDTIVIFLTDDQVQPQPASRSENWISGKSPVLYTTVDLEDGKKKLVYSVNTEITDAEWAAAEADWKAEIERVHPELTPEQVQERVNLKRVECNAITKKARTNSGNEDYSITEVVIGEGVTGIGWYYVEEKGDATGSPYLPIRYNEWPYEYVGKSTTQDKTNIFVRCKALTSVTFEDPESIQVIGVSAFRHCTALTEFPFDQLTNLR